MRTVHILVCFGLRKKLKPPRAMSMGFWILMHWFGERKKVCLKCSIWQFFQTDGSKEVDFSIYNSFLGRTIYDPKGDNVGGEIER